MSVGALHSLAIWAHIRPEAEAVVDASTGEVLSFAALHGLARRVAALLARVRGDEGRFLVFSATTCLPTFVALHAAILAGIPFLPLHPRLTAGERAAILSFLGARASDVLDDDALASIFGEARRLGGPHGVDIDPTPDAAVSPKGVLALLHTSGTTGIPKLASLSRRAFAASAWATTDALQVVDDDRWLLALPLCHVGGLSILTRSLARGTQVVLLPRFSAAAAVDAIARHGATLFPLVPTMLRDLLQRLPEGARLPRAVIVGGAGCPSPLLVSCAERGLLALTTYGLTETCSQVTLQPLRPPNQRAPGSGVTIRSSNVTIVDAEGRPLGAGETGEIVASGSTLFDGYLDAPAGEGAGEGGAARFATGDFGFLDRDGTLFVEGRRADRIVTGGENVAPTEVEAAARTARGVRDAVVFGVPDERWGEAVALCVVAEDPVFDESALEVSLRAALSSFKRPRVFARIEAVPLTSMGKIDRRAARARYSPQVRAFSAKKD